MSTANLLLDATTVYIWSGVFSLFIFFTALNKITRHQLLSGSLPYGHLSRVSHQLQARSRTFYLAYIYTYAIFANRFLNKYFVHSLQNNCILGFS